MIICQFIEIIDVSDSIFSIPEAAVLKTENETFVLTFMKEDGDLFPPKTVFSIPHLKRRKIPLNRLPHIVKLKLILTY